MTRRRRGRLPLLLLLALMVAGLAYAYATTQQRLDESPAPPPAATGTLRVHYLDVGQGDATIWEMPDGRLVLYDCGPPAADARSNPVVRYLQDELGRAPGSRIDALVASHGHLDHVGGCDEVLDEFVLDEIHEIGYAGDDAPESYHRFRAKVATEGARVHTFSSWRVGAELLPGATFLAPAQAPSSWDDAGPASIVLRVRHGATAFCFQGDIEAPQERSLAATALPCDAYLVGHHGSKSASTREWLAAIRPDVAVVSFGVDNEYGHPTPEALCRVQQAGATVYATARAGAVVLASDGTRVVAKRGRPETTDYCAPGAAYTDDS